MLSEVRSQIVVTSNAVSVYGKNSGQLRIIKNECCGRCSVYGKGAPIVFWFLTKPISSGDLLLKPKPEWSATWYHSIECLLLSQSLPVSLSDSEKKQLRRELERLELAVKMGQFGQPVTLAEFVKSGGLMNIGDIMRKQYMYRAYVLSIERSEKSNDRIGYGEILLDFEPFLSAQMGSGSVYTDFLMEHADEIKAAVADNEWEIVFERVLLNPFNSEA